MDITNNGHHQTHQLWTSWGVSHQLWTSPNSPIMDITNNGHITKLTNYGHPEVFLTNYGHHQTHQLWTSPIMDITKLTNYGHPEVFPGRNVVPQPVAHPLPAGGEGGPADHQPPCPGSLVQRSAEAQKY